jgi:hypothetical protein
VSAVVCTRFIASVASITEIGMRKCKRKGKFTIGNEITEKKSKDKC